MVLDTSALVAVALREPGHERLLDAMTSAESVVVGAPTLVEAGMVLTSRLRRDARRDLAALLGSAEAEVVPFTHAHYEAAVEAFLRFGKGRHPVRLNFGDCMSYAVAAVSGMPLLFTGDDFAKTDIPAA